MDSAEKITGEKIEEILLQLIVNKTFIQSYFPKTDDGELTVVSEIKSFKSLSYLVFDQPKHLKGLSDGEKADIVEFQFMGKDNLLYTFSSSLFKILNNEIWVHFPSEILKHQRRNFFRLSVPVGTRLHFSINNIPVKMIVSNISLGGTFGTLISSYVPGREDFFLQNDELIENLELTFPGSKNEAPIRIRKAMVTRREMNNASGDFHYAIEFIDMAPTEERILTTTIYKIQGQYLKSRLS
jgi:c-di-GMP-binding flagellar brake protein YcgR